MGKKNPSAKQALASATRTCKNKGNPPIRKLTAKDDPAALFSSGRQDGPPGSFADALAGGIISPAVLSEMLTQKEELPTPAQTLQDAIRNSPPPQERLDLHGCTAQEAQMRAEHFLTRARRNHLKTVLIVTGKGLHSPEGPVLKDVIEARLKIMKNDGTILAWLWEKKSRDKSGALLVYLP